MFRQNVEKNIWASCSASQNLSTFTSLSLLIIYVVQAQHCCPVHKAYTDLQTDPKHCPYSQMHPCISNNLSDLLKTSSKYIEILAIRAVWCIILMITLTWGQILYNLIIQFQKDASETDKLKAPRHLKVYRCSTIFNLNLKNVQRLIILKRVWLLKVKNVGIAVFSRTWLQKSRTLRSTGKPFYALCRTI